VTGAAKQFAEKLFVRAAVALSGFKANAEK
jgi:hypothetical protein